MADTKAIGVASLTRSKHLERVAFYAVVAFAFVLFAPLQESVRKGKVKDIFNSNPVEFKKDSVVIEVHGKTQEIAND